MKTKVCFKCKKELPSTSEYFHYERTTRDNLKSWCIKCVSEYNKEYRKKNKEKIKRQTKEWRDNNREKVREYRNTEKYIETHNKSNKKWKKKNWEEYMEKHLLHKRIRKIKPKQQYCTICNETKRLDLANISGEYKEDIEDYMWLCHKCHNLYDNINQTHRTGVKV